MLTIESLSKSYGGDGAGRRGLLRRKPAAHGTDRVFAVDDVSFEVHDGELFTLLGPSGCGKTTTLRSVAGLEKPDRGRIALNERALFDGAARTNMPANQRGLGMVFQSYAIWPHMTVFKNVSFPLDVLSRGRRPARSQVREQVMRVLEVTELSKFADRPATKLSGGQQQRLALARALVTQPDLMLLDEPLSNLDAKLRETMRFELKRLQRELGLTTVYVTHDQAEALAMSTRIAVMNAGRIEQIGKPRDIYMKPETQFVAEFIGTSNFITGKVGPRIGDVVRIDTPEGTLWSSCASALTEGNEALVALRPESLSIAPTAGPAPNMRNEWRGSVLNRAFMGDSVDHIVGIGKFELRVRCNPSISIAPQTEVYVCVDPENVTVVPTA
jgi:iron(III) transport system ATP-binding protein